MRPITTSRLSLTLFFFVLSSVFLFHPALSEAGSQWSKTNPEVNLTHIFQGQINRRGKPVGFHARPGGKNPAGAKIKSINSGPNGAGIYTARVLIKDPSTGSWKDKFSTFYPDNMDRQEVVDVILHAWKHRTKGKERPWEGPSGKGFMIQGYLNQRGNINTAFPIYRK